MIGMLATLTVAALAAGTTHTDTTFAVKAGTRLELNQFSGSIAVQTWSKNAVRVSAQHGSRVEIQMGGTWPTLTIQSVHWRGIPSTVEYQLTVPKWMALSLSGVNTDVSVEDSGGEIHIETVQGEVTVSGGSKVVQASSVDGEVHVVGASGRIECSSVSGAVHVERSSGPVAASSVNGEITLDGLDSDDVEASTVNGTVSYEGAIRKDGSYRFSTHNGDVSVGIPEGANATVSVATFSGEFGSDVPIQIRETRRGKRFNFTLGDGSARIELESFQGSIRLHRPGNPEVRTRVEQKMKETIKEKEKTKTKDKSSGEGEGER